MYTEIYTEIYTEHVPHDKSTLYNRIQKSPGSVSYTHLDVYKRQAQHILPPVVSPSTFCLPSYRPAHSASSRIAQHISCLTVG